VFYISCGFLTATNIVYLIWGSAKKQPWDDPDMDNKIVENGANSDESNEKNDDGRMKK
jgi:hypothetical protein